VDDLLRAIIHPTDLPLVSQLLNSARKGEMVPSPLDIRLRGVSDEYRLVRAELRGWDDDLGTTHMLFIANDITQEVKSNDEIRTTRELLDETEQLLQFGSWTWDLGTNEFKWSPGLFALLDYKEQEVQANLGLDFYLSHVLDEYTQTLQETIFTSLKDKTDFLYEYVIRTNAGAIKNVSTKGKVVINDSGEVVKMLSVNRDITALRSFEKEQERNIRELNRSNRDLEEFAYIASHDLQEPLRKISMFTERLKAKYENNLDKEGELFIDRILASAGNMRTLIENLLEFSRANRRSNTFDRVDLKEALERVISELELKIEEAEASIILSGAFPVIEAATSEMNQLFSNILSNAIKFRKGEGTPRVEVRAVKLTKTERHELGLPGNNNFYKIEIEDNGIGFEPEYSEKIFQIFQRLNGKSEYPGSGIGLAICKKIVEKHNGMIFAKSQPDHGATFTVILPEKQF
jgi:signal transduction histidine kinase